MRFVLVLWALAGCQVDEQKKQQAAVAHCDRVGETLASFELGNYAPKEQRAPVVAKYVDQCKTKRVTQAEADCVFKARDTWAAKACVPSLFRASGGTSDCKQAIARMREAFIATLGSAGGSATAQIDTMMPVIQLACEQDQWPAAVTQCMIAAKPGDMTAFQQCAAQLSQDMQDKMAKRMLAREQQK